HPQKLEVRFADVAAVTAAVRHVVRKGVATAPWLGEAAGSAPVNGRAVASYAPPADPLSGPGRGAAEEGRAPGPPPPPGALELDAPRARDADAGASLGGWTERMRASIAARAVVAARLARPARDATTDATDSVDAHADTAAAGAALAPTDPAAGDRPA